MAAAAGLVAMRRFAGRECKFTAASNFRRCGRDEVLFIACPMGLFQVVGFQRFESDG